MPLYCLLPTAYCLLLAFPATVTKKAGTLPPFYYLCRKIYFDMITNDNIKDLTGRRDALRRYL
jgi:hypothetical protein